MPPPSPYGDWSERLMRAMPGTLDELAARLDVKRARIDKWTQRLHAYGWIRVANWTPPTRSGRWHAVFQAGPGKDKPRPPRVPLLVRVARSRQRMIADGRYHEWLAKRRVRSRIERITSKGTPASPWDALMR